MNKTSTSSSRRAVTLAFALQGMLLAAILSDLPAIRADLGATDGLLAIMIGLVSVLAAVGSVLAEKIAQKTHSAQALGLGLTILVAGGSAIAANTGMTFFLAAVALYGIGVGVVDAAGNMQAAALQQRYGKVILGGFFAAWSAGAIVGAVLASAGEALALGYRWTLVGAVGFVLAIGLVIYPRFLKDGSLPASAPHLDEKILPWRPIMLIGLAMALFFAIDFGLSNWSALLLHDELGADTSTAAMGVAAYQIAGLLTRLTVDAWTRRYGAVRVVAVGGGIAVLGLLLTILAPSVPLALLGLAVVGLGAPVVAPLCFSVAANLAQGQALDATIARLNLFNYAGTIVGGVVIGTALALSNARISFVIPLLAAVGLVLLAPAFATRHQSASK